MPIHMGKSDSVFTSEQTSNSAIHPPPPHPPGYLEVFKTLHYTHLSKWTVSAGVLCCGEAYRPAKGEQGGCDLGHVLLLPQIDCLEHVHISNAVVLQCLLEPETYSQCC
jgi:hypothetical protein